MMAWAEVSAMPVRKSTGCSAMPVGVKKAVADLSAWMLFMNEVQIGAAPLPPVIWRPLAFSMSRRRPSRLSKPIQTLTTSSGVKPVNQASVLSLVVPVLPATGPRKPRARTARPVPRLTMCCIRLITTAAYSGSTAGTGFGRCAYRDSPAASSMRAINVGAMRKPYRAIAP